MVRFFKFLVFVIAFSAGTTLLTTNTFAQTPTSTPTSAPTSLPTSSNNATGTPSPLVTPRAGAISAAADVVSTEQVTATTPTTSTSPNQSTNLIPTATPAPVGQQGDDATPATDVVQQPSGPLEGTIIANRAEVVAQFFLEGQTYVLNAGRSQGITLTRSSTGLNLFNCAGDLATDTPGCYWDPYVVIQNGFYEIYDVSSGAEQVKLMLREAGAPPTGQVYVQNRTEHKESVVFRDEVFDIEPTLVLEFPVAEGVPAILYVRSCLTIDNQSACEWAPKSLNAGVYYAMVEVDVPGSQSGSMQTTIDLRPIVGEVNEPPAAAPETEVSVAGGSVLCSVVVPALNVRSGPGLQYSIIDKVRTTDGASGTVNVTGRSSDNEWLTVEETVAIGGWINNSPSFITCSGDLLALPIVESPPTPTPQPAIVSDAPPAAPAVEQPVAEATSESIEPGTEPQAPSEEITQETATQEATTEQDTDVAIPAGQAMLVINNGFQHEIRFTLDQQYRVVEGPSEFDLQPGQAISIIVYPGNIPFSGSSPWSGLSGNASITVGPDQSLPLWLRFEPEANGTWVFRWN